MKRLTNTLFVMLICTVSLICLSGDSVSSNPQLEPVCEINPIAHVEFISDDDTDIQKITNNINELNKEYDEQVELTQQLEIEIINRINNLEQK